jgi:hypothetical protein
MTKRQAERTPIRPTRGAIVYAAVLASIGVTALIVEWITGSDALGVSLGVFVAVVLIFGAVDATVQRARAQRSADQEAATAELDKALNTGMWKHPENSGMECQIRYDPGTGLFYVSGWISDFWIIVGERVWPDLDGLVALIRDLEHEEGMVATDDEGTRSIKARLMAPGWNDEVRSMGIHPEPDGS